MARSTAIRIIAVLLGHLCAWPLASAEGLDIKSMILMPGPLIQAHAEEEAHCESCHSSFDKSSQDSLCLDCHKPIAIDRSQDTGFHGRSPLVGEAECRTCHKDHKGRDYNSVLLDRDTFAHSDTDFALLGAHATTLCEGCHEEGAAYREAPGTCHGCHQEQDPHGEALGVECGNCHESSSWHDRKPFDHDSTEFPLRGHHETLNCSSCHAGEQYNFENNDCVSCHRVQDVHLGRYGDNCDRCHSQRDWKNRAFEHAAESGFRLTGAHDNLACKSCHFESLTGEELSTDCVSCHAGSDIHAGRHGKQCGDCHSTHKWSSSSFDHRAETKWPLLGGHEGLACLQCHRGSLEEKLAGDCGDCHAGDDVHRSARLEDCALCHSPADWEKTPGFDHELTLFPLEGMHAITGCSACHQNHEFSSADSSCVDCHREDDTHESGLGEDCASCHSPNGWQLWSFDHKSATGFGLEGAHDDLTCGSCHRGSQPGDVAGTCAGCHAADDRHGGGFGENCGRCHTNESFEDVRWSN